MDFSTLLIVGSIAFLLSGTIKGLAGIGLPTAAIGLLTLFFDPRTAIALVMFPMLGSNAWMMFRAGSFIRTVQRYWVFALVLLIGVTVTTFGTKDAGDRVLQGVLGVVILIFVGVSWRGWMPVLPERFDKFVQLIFGAIAGFVGGLTAGWGAPVAMYLATRDVDKDEFVRAAGFLITVGSIPLAYAYAKLGFLTGPLAAVSAGMLVPTLIGFSTGEHLRKKLSLESFRNMVLIVFVFLGLNLLRRAIWSA